MTPSPEGLADKLTATQRSALEHIGKPWRFPVRWSALVGYSLEAMGLAKRTFWQDKTYITPLGERVRDLLRARESGQ